MIELSDVYKVVVAMVPLYVALMLGYGSVKWWRMFTPEQSDAINRMTCYFIIPFLTFQFTTHLNPYKMNSLFVAADVISKCGIGAMLGLWAYFFGGSYEWCITGFSISSITNALIVGVPLMRAMYGSVGVDLVIQSAIMQNTFWLIVLFFMLEVRRARLDFDSVAAVEMSSGKDLEGSGGVHEVDVSVVRPSVWAMLKVVFEKLAKNPNCYACIVGLIWAFVAARWHFEMPSIMEGSILVMSKAGTGTSMFCMGVPLMRAMYGALGEDLVIQSAVLQSIIWVMILLFMLEVRRARRDFDSVAAVEMSSGKDLEGNSDGEVNVSVVRPSAWILMRTVLGKLAKNPNCYACIAGLVWAFLAARWHFEMPSIMEGSILVMSKAGTGTSMFCMGLFMASNDKIMACGAKATIIGMILRFIVGPMSVGLACLAVGLRGDVLRIAIVQSALPQAVATFIYAKEYGLHTNAISTAVIFGTVVSLPILIGYFAVLDLIRI
ncbi:auxin efflux carrier component 5 [Daucus carota subsp. sativus]|uniref:auxin efflux carrier component 5 n=1 Tax=Daucus carota subsp. sativus TaxID=79200 RepID=UPI0030828FA5